MWLFELLSVSEPALTCVHIDRRSVYGAVGTSRKFKTERAPDRPERAAAEKCRYTGMSILLYCATIMDPLLLKVMLRSVFATYEIL